MKSIFDPAIVAAYRERQRKFNEYMDAHVGKVISLRVRTPAPLEITDDRTFTHETLGAMYDHK